MAALHHQRTPSHPHKRYSSSKAAALKKNPSHSQHGAKKEKSVIIRETEEQDDEVMAVSFLQFCATCEKQIIVPSNSVLYCSESCRRKDNNKTLPSASIASDYTPPTSPLRNFTFDDFPPAGRDIVPRRSPTMASNVNRLSCSSISSSNDGQDSRHDSVLSSTAPQRPSLKDRNSSEAALYLRQFHSSGTLTDHRSIRPRYNRAPNSCPAPPELSNTPTPASSFGAPMPYTPINTTSTRPLPRRTNPYFSSSHTNGIELVNPFAAPTKPDTTSYHHAITTVTPPSSYANKDGGSVSASAPARAYGSLKAQPTVARPDAGVNIEGEMFAKKARLPEARSAGSLKQLFRFEEMRAPPKKSEVLLA